MTWAYYPAEHIRNLTENVCFARGMARACGDMLCLAQDEDMTLAQRLHELNEYTLNYPMYQPKKPFPVSPRYQPNWQENAGEEYTLLTALLEEEARHGYIKGKHSACVLAHNMMVEQRRHTEEELLRNITAFCQATIDTVGGDKA